jgi:putative MATE family efflux protein
MSGAIQKTDLTSGGVYRSLMRMALPTTLAYVVMNVSLLIDTYFVGAVGSDAVGGVTAAGILVGILITLSASSAMGAEVMISRAWGAKRYEDARLALSQAFVAALALSALVTVAGLLGARPALGLLGLSPEVREQGARYLEVMFGGASMIFLFVPATVAMRATGDAITPMKAVALATIVNAALDPLLILGVGPIPALGTAGAGYASVLGRAVGLVYLGRRFLARDSELRLVPRLMVPRPDVLKSMGNVGLFAALWMFFYDISGLVLIRTVAGFGSATVAAYGIVMRIYSAVTLPAFGFATASSALVGQNLGAGKPERALATTRAAILTYGVVMVLVAAALVAFALPVMSVFAREAGVAEVGAWGLMLFAPSFPAVTVSMTLGRSMSGAGDTRSPMVMAFISQILVRIPAALLLSAALAQTGLWLALALSNVANMMAAIALFARGRWRRVDPSVRTTKPTA